MKSLRGKLSSQERKQEERSRELDYLKQELSANEQAREQSDRLIASLQTHLEQEAHAAQQRARQVGSGVSAQQVCSAACQTGRQWGQCPASLLSSVPGR